MYVTYSARYRLVKKSTLALYVHTLFTGVMYSIPLSPTAGLRQLQHCVLYEGKRGRTRSNAPPLSLPDFLLLRGTRICQFSPRCLLWVPASELKQYHCRCIIYRVPRR